MRRLLLALGPVLGLVLAGCGFTPFDPPRADAIKPGPGILTGEAGAFVLRHP